jgi:hypothetical protein
MSGDALLQESACLWVERQNRHVKGSVKQAGEVGALREGRGANEHLERPVAHISEVAGALGQEGQSQCFNAFEEFLCSGVLGVEDEGRLDTMPGYHLS